MNLQRFLLVGAVLSLVFIQGCGDEIIAIDPCAEQTAVTAKFTIYENVSDSLFASDTVLQYNTIVFKADENYDTYEWRIGQDARVFTTKAVTLHFQQPVGRIEITLKVTRKPNLSCFPEDDGTDITTKPLTVIDWRNSLVIGEYTGSNKSNPQAHFDVSMKRTLDIDSFPIYELLNINQGCFRTNLWSGEVGRGAKAFRFSDYVWYGDGCKGVECWITLLAGDSVRIDYSYGDNSKPFTPSGYPRIRDVYLGKRKN